MSCIRYRAVTKEYPGFTLGPVTLDIPRGFVTGLVGANGAGKTTLIKLALGLVHPASGAVDIVDRSHVGVVYDVPTYPAEWTVRDVARAMRPFYRDWSDATFDRLATWADLDPRKKVKELSRGMGLKLQLAVALSHQPQLLILDEPTAGLDPLARSQLLDLLAEYMTDDRNAVLFSSHITTDLDRIADFAIMLVEGKVRASETLSDLVDGYRLVRGTHAALPAVRELVHGLRTTPFGWQGLMATEDTVHLGPDCAVGTPTLDDIVVHLAKESVHV